MRVQSSSQLVVRDLGSEEANALVYSIHNLDPDRPVDWNLIELIVCFARELCSAFIYSILYILSHPEYVVQYIQFNVLQYFDTNCS